MKQSQADDIEIAEEHKRQFNSEISLPVLSSRDDSKSKQTSNYKNIIPMLEYNPIHLRNLPPKPFQNSLIKRRKNRLTSHIENLNYSNISNLSPNRKKKDLDSKSINNLDSEQMTNRQKEKHSQSESDILIEQELNSKINPNIKHLKTALRNLNELKNHNQFQFIDAKTVQIKYQLVKNKRENQIKKKDQSINTNILFDPSSTQQKNMIVHADKQDHNDHFQNSNQQESSLKKNPIVKHNAQASKNLTTNYDINDRVRIRESIVQKLQRYGSGFQLSNNSANPRNNFVTDEKSTGHKAPIKNNLIDTIETLTKVKKKFVPPYRKQEARKIPVELGADIIPEFLFDRSDFCKFYQCSYMNDTERILNLFQQG